MSVETFSLRICALQAIEARMGAIASLLSDVADALTSHPDGLLIEDLDQPLPSFAVVRKDANIIRAAEWPSLESIQALLADWHAEMVKAHRVWQHLQPSERQLLMDPRTCGPNPITPLV